jgi:hypothetical protein
MRRLVTFRSLTESATAFAIAISPTLNLLSPPQLPKQIRERRCRFHKHESATLAVIYIPPLFKMLFVPALSTLPILLVASLDTIFFVRFPEPARLSVSEHENDTDLNVIV